MTTTYKSSVIEVANGCTCHTCIRFHTSACISPICSLRCRDAFRPRPKKAAMREGSGSLCSLEVSWSKECRSGEEEVTRGSFARCMVKKGASLVIQGLCVAVVGGVTVRLMLPSTEKTLRSRLLVLAVALSGKLTTTAPLTMSFVDLDLRRGT